jgi:hypothetical protein
VEYFVGLHVSSEEEAGQLLTRRQIAKKEILA